MSTRVVDQVDGWDEQSFSGGYRELHELADREFSGVVRAGGAELYMTRGVAVGLRMGDIEDFESAGTVYEAPADALPLLAIMQERNDEVKAKYYSEKTSISEVDETLSDGGFTGFIELSENVLSGDYYLVYQAGKSMSVAFVGESSRLISGDEAFETADDEVGIYKVRPAEIEPVDIPEPTGKPEPDAGETTGAATADGVDEDADAPAETENTQAEEGPTGPDGEPPATAGGGESRTDGTAGSSEATAADEPAPEEPTEETTDEPESGKRRSGEPSRKDRPAEKETREEPEGGDPVRGRADPSEPGDSKPPNKPRPRSDQSSRNRRPEPSRTEQPAGRSGRRGQSAPRESVPAAGRDLETKAIPSLDPGQTEVPEGTPGSSPPGGTSVETADGGAGSTRGPPREEVAGERRQAKATGAQAQPERTQTQPQPPETATRSRGDVEGETERQGDVDGGPGEERIETLETELEEKEERIDELQGELESAETERDDLADELEALEDERDELAAEVSRLEGELEKLEEELGAATDGERRITAGEALAGTDIFVRYRSKGKPTLKKAHGSSTRKDEVNENLRLEKHTQFDADAVAVGGRSYDEFLESTLEFQFVRWVVRELLFEIRETGHQKALGDLYDVLPQIDRAELAGVVDVVYTEDGQETQSQESFDVVLRNRMGHPLLAANLNDSREATTEGMMEKLITSAERVGRSNDTFSGAFLVTESFFDPGALEIASDATQGGLLSRDKRESFVNLSRKTGYHLCLVEARNENFHLAVPEL